MKGLSYSLLRAACALVIGLVLVLFPDQAAQYLVVTVGCVFLVPSFISIVAWFARPAAGRGGFPLLGVGSFLFGLWLVIAPAFFADLLTYVLGFILLMGGVQQIAVCGTCAHFAGGLVCSLQSVGSTLYGVRCHRDQQLCLCAVRVGQLVRVLAPSP